MNIIDQLERTVTPAVMGNESKSSSVAYMSLLEQFYAILAARLAVPQIYSQLLRTDQVVANSAIPESPLFEQIWQDPNLQNTLVQELAATHHIDEQTTTQLLISATPLVYRELKALANGQFLPAFLQAQQSTFRPYLPIWSAPIIASTHVMNQEVQTSLGSDDYSIPVGLAHFSDTFDDANSNINVVTPSPNTQADVPNPQAEITGTTSPERMSLEKGNRETIERETAERAITEGVDPQNIDKERTTVEMPNDHTDKNDAMSADINANSDAIHASPAAYHLAENRSLKREQVRTRNQRNDLLIRVFLLIVAIAALALAAWALLIKPNNEIPVESTVTVPAVVPPTPEPPVPTLTPAELIVGVDNSGNLYTCSATVGDVSLQSTLQQALNTSFGEQASICELNVKDGVAATITNMPVELLPNVMTMLRSTPFARLHIQNDRLMLEAPDSMLLQNLVMEIRNLVPAMIVESSAPLPLPNNGDTANAMANANEASNQFAGDGINPNNPYNNDGLNNGTGEYQASDDDTNDRVIPAPFPSNNMSNSTNNLPNNGSSNLPNNPSLNNREVRPPGPFSPSEVNEMANTVIVAEPAQVR